MLGMSGVCGSCECVSGVYARVLAGRGEHVGEAELRRPDSAEVAETTWLWAHLYITCQKFPGICGICLFIC